MALLEITLAVDDDNRPVLNGFASAENATAYLSSDLFTADVIGELNPLLASRPEIRVYEEA